ncbi:MAG: TonB-dependent receptor [Bacteroidetes bacterium]|nr:TonB-dependent receptor [Bacteroidota bacterium]MCB0842109.1 TonB-dependent receptor [Bacteroidota bacterium]
MLHRISLIVLFLTLFAQASFAQFGKLKGKILDENGAGIEAVRVIVFDGELVKYGALTDASGEFSIQPVAPGTYRVEARYLTGTKSLEDVSVIANQTRDISISFRDDETTTTLETVEIFGNPVFEKDPAVTTTLTGQDIQKIGTRSVQSLAALTPGVYQSDEGNGINIRGARSEGTIYYVDGMKIRGLTSLPQNSIAQLQVITGGTPAEFGDFTGGVINITTASPTSTFTGGLELITSEYLDSYGRNLVGANLSGPLIKRKREIEGRVYESSMLSFFINGEFDYNLDRDPAALGIYKLDDALLADLEQNPMQISEDGLSFRSRANYINSDDFVPIKTKVNNSSTRIRGLGRLDFQPSDNVLIKVGGNYEFIRNDNWSLANSLFAPDPQGEALVDNYRVWGRFQQTFAGGENSAVRNLFYSIQADYSKYYQVSQNSVHQDNIFDYGYIGKFTFDRVPVYGYVDNPWDEISSSPYWRTIGYGFDHLVFDPSETKNPLLANYNTSIIDYIAENGITNINSPFIDPSPTTFQLSSLNDLLFRQGLRNGDGPRSIYSLFTGIGANTGSYSKFDLQQFRLVGQATAEIKGHNLKAGFEFEQRVERSYGISARALWPIMRQYANFHLQNLEDDPSRFEYVTVDGEFQDTVIVPLRYAPEDQADFDKALREKLGLPIDGTDWINIDELSPDFFSLDMFTAEEALSNGLGFASYLGYDFKGNKTDPVDQNLFFTDEENRPINPYSPTYVSAFIQDKFEFEDIIFNVGLRVDRFDGNQLVLKDNYSLFPSYTAGEVASGNLGIPSFTLPSGIGSDFVPYVNDPTNFSEVIGYRDGETWYDANGAPISSTVIAARSGGKPLPATKEEKVGSDSFEDYTPRTTFMPRISFSFPISDVALFFAHYDVLAQRPGGGGGGGFSANISQYTFLENNPGVTVTNPNLRPEITIDYEAGFKQKLGESMALTMSAFYREQRNMIRLRRFANAYPFSYDTYDNLDFGTIKGFSFAYDMRRTRNVQLRASYTLQFADATGSDFSSARNIITYLEGVGILRVPLPINTDQRHRITSSVDYRFGRNNMGPSIGFGEKSIHPLKNFGANMTLTLGSGTPFTKNAVVVPAVASGEHIVNIVQGTPNGARKPWQFRMDLRFDKSFVIGNKPKEGGGFSKAYDFNVYLLMLNALDTRNVIGVYRYTGLPDDDGFLASDGGQQRIVTQVDPTAYVDQYTLRVQNPSNYSIPRRIRLGVQFNF